MQPVILWDIDGTLVRSNGARIALGAFVRALRQTCDLPEEFAYPKDAGGKTDIQIAIEMLTTTSMAEQRALQLLGEFGTAYETELQRQSEQLTTDLRVLPGVREALARVQALGITQSVLTGNLEPIAKLKLGCAGLGDYVDFDLGAYGSDHRDRTCLVPVARQRLSQRLGSEVRAEDIVVVGDTPRDIACARAGGARAVAVATGYHTREELEAHQPDAVLDDLSNIDQVMGTLLGWAAAIQ